MSDIFRFHEIPLFSYLRLLDFGIFGGEYLGIDRGME